MAESGMAAGSGGELNALDAIWTFGALGGDRNAPLLRDGVPTGVYGAQLLARGGHLYLRDFDGGWRRYVFGAWHREHDVDPQNGPQPSDANGVGT